MKTLKSLRPRRIGASNVGLTLMMACLSLAGIFWLKATSLEAGTPQPAEVSAEQVGPNSGPGIYTKNIEDIKAGELVWAYDATHGKWQAEPVIKPLVHNYAGDMVSISVDDQTITSTGNHPYWVAGGINLFDRPQAKDVDPSDRASAIASGKGRWIAARKLQVGDLLMLRDGRLAPVSEVRVGYAKQKVYNLEVADLHTYGVSPLGIGVHNCPTNCFPPGTLILMGDGSVKPIEDIQLGDQVMAGDPMSRAPPEPAGVIGLLRDSTTCLADISLHTSTGTTATIAATRHHRIWTNDRGWVEAENLKVGDVLQDSSRTSVAVTAVKLRSQLSRSYNFEVRGMHTYYALAGDGTPVLVHNGSVTIGQLPIYQSGTIINIGGEGEVGGAINVQGPGALSPGWGTSGTTDPLSPGTDTPVEGGLPIWEVQGPTVIADPNALPFADNSIPIVVTNGVPIDLPPTIYGPSVNSQEIQRILQPGGVWNNNGTTTYVKPAS